MSSKTGIHHATVEGTRLEILKFFRSFYRRNGIPPTIREVMTARSVSSSSTVAYHIAKLVEAGYLKRVGEQRSRGLVPVSRPLPRHVAHEPGGSPKRGRPRKNPIDEPEPVPPESQNVSV